MAKELITNSYIFNPTLKTINLSSIPNFNIRLLRSITNTVGNKHIYVLGGENGLGYTAVNNSVITLEYDTTSMDANDVLTIQYDDKQQYITNRDGVLQPMSATDNGAVAVGNAMIKIKDGFDEGLNSTKYDITTTSANNVVRIGGRNGGAKYLSISPCPITPSASYTIISKAKLKIPNALYVSMSMSQRFAGTNVEISLVGVDDNGNVEMRSDVSKNTPLLTGTNITVSGSVGTINFVDPHPFAGGERVILYGNTDTRLNVGPVVLTRVSNTQITVPISLTSGTYVANGFIKYEDVLGGVKNGVGFYLDNTTATQSGIASTRGEMMPWNNNNTAFTINTTVATQPLNTQGSDSFISANKLGITNKLQSTSFISRANNSTGASTNFKLDNPTPDEDKEYKLKIQVKNFANLTRPVAMITVIAKLTASTLATITTDVAHGLTASSFVFITGVRDIVNFPNLASAVQVSSIVSPTEFTINIGPATSAVSTGGMVVISNGNTAQTLGNGLSVQSISRTKNIITLTMNTTATGLVGELFALYGCDAVGSGGERYNGNYRITRVNASTYEAILIGDSINPPFKADFSAINCGGSFFRRTEVRIDNYSLMEITRHIVELDNANGTVDSSASSPVSITNTPSVAVSGTAQVNIASVTAGVGILTNASTPVSTADIVSGAITTSTTSPAITPASGLSYAFLVNVSAVSGTNPILDMVIEASEDGGTSWLPLYAIPRITATGSYRTPFLPARGDRIRYVRQVGGTTPSFTMAVARISSSAPVFGNPLSVFERSLIVNTLNAVSPNIFVASRSSYTVVLAMSNVGSPAPQVQLEGSLDGVNWYSIGTPMTGAVSPVNVSYTGMNNTFIRFRTSTAGVSSTLNYIGITGI